MPPTTRIMDPASKLTTRWHKPKVIKTAKQGHPAYNPTSFWPYSEVVVAARPRPDTVGEWGCGVGAGSVGWPAPLEAGHVAPPAAPRPARPRRDRPPRAGSLSGGNPYFILRDRLGAAVFTDGDFADLYPECGQPACAPWRLALVTLLQFREGLSDRRGAAAGRGESG